MKLQNDYTESSGFEPLPPGEYYSAIVKCERRVSQSGNTYYSITLQPEGSNRKLFDNIFIDEAFLATHQFATNKIVSLLRACNFPCGSKAGEDVNIPHADAFLAKMVYAQVSIDKKDATKNLVFHYYGTPKSTREKPKASSVYDQRTSAAEATAKAAEVAKTDQVRQDFEKDGNPF